jgi:hypothetical protein
MAKIIGQESLQAHALAYIIKNPSRHSLEEWREVVLDKKRLREINLGVFLTNQNPGELASKAYTYLINPSKRASNKDAVGDGMKETKAPSPPKTKKKKKPKTPKEIIASQERKQRIIALVYEGAKMIADVVPNIERYYIAMQNADMFTDLMTVLAQTSKVFHVSDKGGSLINADIILVSRDHKREIERFFKTLVPEVYNKKNKSDASGALRFLAKNNDNETNSVDNFFRKHFDKKTMIPISLKFNPDHPPKLKKIDFHSAELKSGEKMDPMMLSIIKILSEDSPSTARKYIQELVDIQVGDIASYADPSKNLQTDIPIPSTFRYRKLLGPEYEDQDFQLILYQGNGFNGKFFSTSVHNRKKGEAWAGGLAFRGVSEVLRRGYGSVGWDKVLRSIATIRTTTLDKIFNERKANYPQAEPGRLDKERKLLAQYQHFRRELAKPETLLPALSASLFKFLTELGEARRDPKLKLRFVREVTSKSFETAGLPFLAQRIQRHPATESSDLNLIRVMNNSLGLLFFQSYDIKDWKEAIFLTIVAAISSRVFISFNTMRKDDAALANILRHTPFAKEGGVQVEFKHIPHYRLS